MRSARNRWAVLLPTVLVVLAGCAAGDGGSEAGAGQGATGPSGPAGFDEATGGVEGIVLDEEAQPISDAQVAVLEANLQTVSDGAGRFSFSNLEPGRHVVVAQKLGHEAASQSVEVLAGQSVQVNLVLPGIVVHQAHFEVLPKAGIFECTWRHPLGSGVCGYIGQTNGTTGNPLEDHVFTNSQRKWNYDAQAGTMSVLNELTWQQNTAATGDNLRAFFSYANRTASHTYCQADGFTPLQLKWEREEIDDDGECLTGTSGTPSDEPQTIPPEGQKVQTFVSVGVTHLSGQSVSAGIAVDQRFDIWFSLFYWERAPEDFSALPDA